MFFSMSGWIRLHILCMAKKSAKFDGGVISQFLKNIVPNMHGKDSLTFKTHMATTKYFDAFILGYVR